VNATPAIGSLSHARSSRGKTRSYASASAGTVQDAVLPLPTTLATGATIAAQLPGPNPDSDVVAPASSAGNSQTGKQKPVDGKADPSQLYLEVGSFKESGWADKAADQLSGLGFHAITLHKNLLWMQSYHVQVGPFQSEADAEAAQKKLASQNFKSHLVKQ
jgi:cell division protein FtsN